MAAGSNTATRIDEHQHEPLWQERQQLAGFDGSKLSDRELLAVAVGAGVGAAVNGRAHALADGLLARFGSVGAILRAHPAELAIVEGIGPAVAAPLAASFELVRRAALEEPPAKLTNAADIAAVVAPYLHGRTRERAVVVACNRKRRVLGSDVICEGTADRALMSPREAVVAVLRRDGLGFAVAHNHPSGDPTPSAEDLFATSRMQQAAAAVGLQFLGHAVVTDTVWRRVGGYGLELAHGEGCGGGSDDGIGGDLGRGRQANAENANGVGVDRRRGPETTEVHGHEASRSQRRRRTAAGHGVGYSRSEWRWFIVSAGNGSGGGGRVRERVQHDTEAALKQVMAAGDIARAMWRVLVAERGHGEMDEPLKAARRVIYTARQRDEMALDVYILAAFPGALTSSRSSDAAALTLMNLASLLGLLDYVDEAVRMLDVADNDEVSPRVRRMLAEYRACCSAAQEPCRRDDRGG